MLGSLADTALDVIASIATLVGVRIAAVPADSDHRFGHGKAEALVALAQVALISVSAIGIAWRAVDRLMHGAQTEAMGLGIIVSLFAIAGTFALLWYQRRVIARTGSVAIKTDNVHYKSDLMLNGAVIAAVVLTRRCTSRAPTLVRDRHCAVAAPGRLARLERGRQPADGPRMAGGGAAVIPRRLRHLPAARRTSRPTHAKQWNDAASLNSTSGSRPTGRCRKRTTGSMPSRRSCRSGFRAPRY